MKYLTFVHCSDLRIIIIRQATVATFNRLLAVVNHLEWHTGPGFCRSRPGHSCYLHCPLHSFHILYLYNACTAGLYSSLRYHLDNTLAHQSWRILYYGNRLAYCTNTNVAGVTEKLKIMWTFCMAQTNFCRLLNVAKIIWSIVAYHKLQCVDCFSNLCKMLLLSMLWSLSC